MKIKKSTFWQCYVILLLVYIFFKVFMDQYFGGVLKVFLWFTAFFCIFFAFHRTRLLVSDLVMIVMFVLFSIYIICMLYNAERIFFTRAVYEYIVYMAFIFCGMFFCFSTSLESVYKKIIGIGLLLSVSSIVQIVLGGSNSQLRTLGVARSEMAQGMLLGIYMEIVFFYYLREKKREYIFFILLSMIALISTGSRGPLVATMAGMFFMYVYEMLYRKNIKAIIQLVSIIIIAAIFLLWFFNTDIKTGNVNIDFWIGRIKNIINWNSDAGNRTRVVRWERWLETYKKNRMFGIGPSRTGSWNMQVSLGVTESGFIRHLVELGTVGTILYYLPIIYCFISVLRQKMYDKRFVILHIGIIISVLIEDMVLQITEEVTVAFFMWWSIGVCLALIKKYKINSSIG